MRLKAHHVFTAPLPMEPGAPYANVNTSTGTVITINVNALEYDAGSSYANGAATTPAMTPLAGAGAGPGRRVPASAGAPVAPPMMASISPAVGGCSGGVVETTGKLGGGSVGGPCGPRRETVAHLAVLSAMAVRQTDTTCL